MISQNAEQVRNAMSDFQFCIPGFRMGIMTPV